MSSTSKNNENETFLSDWLDNKISDSQLQQLVSESDYLAYKKLKESLDALQVSNPDMDQNYAAIKEKKIAKLNQKPAKVLPLYRYVAVAASLLLFFGLYQLFIFSNTLTTDFGTTLSANLTDNSRVTLNAKSKVAYPNFFKYNRTLKLQGEAYFEVQKGDTFTVETSQGNVTVLGTKFNVIAMPNYFEVHCYEGKVKVTSSNSVTILTHGDIIRFYDNKRETWEENDSQIPLWLTGESTFKNVPLHFVLEQFQKQYNFKMNYPKTVENIKFTGSFTHKNIEVALQSICIPMQLKYTKTNAKTIVLSE